MSDAADIVKMQKTGEGSKNPLDWGHPGNLTEEEANIYLQLRTEFRKRDADFRATVFTFGEEEEEEYALCRWLRARKFNLAEVITMVEQATEAMKSAKAEDFYPEALAALGVEPHIYISQYPQLYTGYTKTNTPLFISKPGVLNVNGITCITTQSGILKYHWHAMIHDFATRLRTKKKEDPRKFTRFECIIVMDLANLSSAQITSRALAIVKENAAIDSLVFPETLCRMVIVNAPKFFTLTWKIIKGWLDPRTQAKIEVISSRSAWEKRLKELVDDDQIPKDYGGTGEDTVTQLLRDAPPGMTRLFTKLLSFRTKDSVVVELSATEKMDVTIFTRSKGGAKISIVDADNTKTVHVQPIIVKHTGGDDLEEEMPSRIELVPTKDALNGGGKYKIKAESVASGYSSSDYLIVCGIY